MEALGSEVRARPCSAGTLGVSHAVTQLEKYLSEVQISVVLVVTVKESVQILNERNEQHKKTRRCCFLKQRVTRSLQQNQKRTTNTTTILAAQPLCPTGS